MKIPADILTVLDSCSTNGTQLVMPKLNPNLYRRVNNILEAAGGKWNRNLQAHVFGEDASDVVDRIILSGEIAVPKDFGCFYTPSPLAERVAAVAGIRPGERVLEPQAGRGSIALAVAKLGGVVDCYELLTANVDHLRTLNLGGFVEQADFLSVTPEAVYDAVCCNPPWGKLAEARHFLHAARFAAPGGRLVAIMPAGITYRNTRLLDDVRAFVDAHCGTIEPLPSQSFRSSGTDVESVLVTVPAFRLQ